MSCAVLFPAFCSRNAILKCGWKQLLNCTAFRHLLPPRSIKYVVAALKLDLTIEIDMIPSPNLTLIMGPSWHTKDKHAKFGRLEPTQWYTNDALALAKRV